MKDSASRSDQSRSNAETVSLKGTVGFASVSPVAQRVGENSINIAVKKQLRSNWCWAAVCEAYTGTDQETLANTYTPGWAKGGNGKYEDPCDVLRKEGKQVDVHNGKKPDWKELVYIIDLQGEPPILMVGKHFIIMCGYKGNTGNVKDRIYVYKDPADGDKLQEATEDELLQMNGGYRGFYDVF